MATFDNHNLFGFSSVAAVTSQTAGTAIFNVQPLDGTKFASSNQNIVIWPASTNPTKANAMVARITGNSTDTLTVSYPQEGSTTITITVGMQVANAYTPKVLTDIETQVNTDGTNIATNTANIATNTANITSNTSSISTINGRLPVGTVLGNTDTQILTNKTINAANNTITNIGTPELKDANVTSRKMKLDQIQYVTSTTDPITSSATYVDVTGLSITFTPNVASNFLVLVQITGNMGSGSQTGNFAVNLDGSITGNDPLIQFMTGAGENGLNITSSAFLWITGITQATHTIKVQAKGIGGSTTHMAYGSLTVIPFAS